ncbi:MAG: PD40 domain-containing protein [Gemmatimonadetes bacterium]|nr:PD40 domain-containing protein [Gemmatimonadota bacterium]
MIAPVTAAAQTTSAASLLDSREMHLRNVRQLTFGGQNAEAYFSFDGKRLTFQSTPREGGCDQIYTLDLADGRVSRVSTGLGRTTCSYYYPAGDRILYSSTHHWVQQCPAPPDMSRGYVWAVYPTFDIFVANADGSNLRQLTHSWGYDAEATFSPRDDRIVFTSMRDGDLDLYSMNPEGGDVRRLTDRLGYDGGAFFSPDGSKIVYRGQYPSTPEEVTDYRALLADGLIRPTRLELYVMNADGSNKQQITNNGKANFAPFWHPSSRKIIFASNVDDPRGRDFDLYLVNLDGSGWERVTYTPDFDGFPVFSPDGRYLVWASNRNQGAPGETNIFIAEWVER